MDVLGVVHDLLALGRVEEPAPGHVTLLGQEGRDDVAPRRVDVLHLDPEPAGQGLGQVGVVPRPLPGLGILRQVRPVGYAEPHGPALLDLFDEPGGHPRASIAQDRHGRQQRGEGQPSSASRHVAGLLLV